MTALAATPDGEVIYAGASDGLYRSNDAGTSWAATAYKGSAFAIATSDDGATVAVVSRETNFFRSPEPDRSWVTGAGLALDLASLYLSTVDVDSNPRAALMVRSGYLSLRGLCDYFNIP